MTLTLDLEPDTQRRLAELAAKSGETLETYARQVLEREAGSGQVLQSAAQNSVLDPADFERGWTNWPRDCRRSYRCPPTSPAPTSTVSIPDAQSWLTPGSCCGCSTAPTRCSRTFEARSAG